MLHKSFGLIVLISILFISCSDNKNFFNKVVSVQKKSEGYQLFRNGQPFLIKGASGVSNFEELKLAGGNTIRLYDTLNLKQHLDLAASLNLAVIVDIPLQVKNMNYIDPDAIVWISEFVNTHKNHPALLSWMLGNEVYFPQLFSNGVTKRFNAILDEIHRLDPNHPVSTAVSTGAVKEILAIKWKSPNIDFISINVFGRINDFKSIKQLLFLWQGPYLLSEWGNNGPWESNSTTWKAPLEQTSTKKAQEFNDRYVNVINKIDDGRFLGSLAFYWGQKQETTHTWFSLFDEQGQKSQAVHELENVWKTRENVFNGPMIGQILLNGKEGWNNMIFTPKDTLFAEIALRNLKDDYHFQWQVLPEMWYELVDDDIIFDEPNLIVDEKGTSILFKCPNTEGPYRLHYKITNKSGYFATANIPFYSMKHTD
ncbi:glycoside hydrolase family 2 TIM barrel-domain containing protein [Maribacter sp. R86514]|uniref:glycoside hydrolase family 2 TIM barrel-domain containing protein n=1 Tax=Maribacter sp. R86514 TaxID=3093854 RepID=UPI0037C76DD6